MTEPMTDAELEAIEKRCEAICVGYWFNDINRLTVYHSFAPYPRQRRNYVVADCYEFQDGDFIAHARTDVPRLLAEVRRLRSGESDVAFLRSRVAVLEAAAKGLTDFIAAKEGKPVSEIEWRCPHMARLAAAISTTKGIKP